MWRHPASAFVADFLGFRTIVDATVSSGVADAGPFGSIPTPDGPDGAVRIVIRPDALRIEPTGHLDAVVRSVTFQGSYYLVALEVGGITAETHVRRPPNAGDRVCLGLDPEQIVVLAD